MPMARYIKLYKLPDEDEIAIVGRPRLMQKSDFAAVFALYKA